MSIIINKNAIDVHFVLCVYRNQIIHLIMTLINECMIKLSSYEALDSRQVFLN